MARLRYNSLSTTLGASLTSSATAVTFAAALTHAGGSVPTISAGDYIPLSILDTAGKAEIVWLTAYTSGATTGTITRAQEGATGVSHASGDKVVHGPTVMDIVSHDHGAKVTSSATTQSIANNAVATLTLWANEKWDTDNYWTSGNPGRFTIPSGYGGKYLVVGHFSFDSSSSFDHLIGLAVNGTAILSSRNRVTSATAHLVTASTLDLAAGDYVEMVVYQNSGTAKSTPTTAEMCEFSLQRLA